MKRVKALVLVSASPRRRELLLRFVPRLCVIRPRVREIPVHKISDLASNAILKLDSVRVDGAKIALSADTAVFLGREVLGKPAGAKEARRMLGRLSGRLHTVITAIAIRSGGRTVVAYDRTRVFFKKLSATQIQAYVATGECLDKAGAYAIQGLGSLLVGRIEGDFFNVVGLPIITLEGLLNGYGYSLLLQ